MDSKVSELDARSGGTAASTAARTASLRTATVPAVAATAVSDVSSNVASTASDVTASVQGTPTAAMDGSITPAATSTAVGYQRAISPRATVTVGGALSGDDSSIGVGAGFGW